MLIHRFYQPQNFFKKSQKKLDFLPKNGKICVKFAFFCKKILRFFRFSLFFLSTVLLLTHLKNQQKSKKRSAFAERIKEYLLFFVSEIVDVRTKILTFLCFGRQKSLNNDSIFQTFLLQTATILIRLGNIAVN